MGSRIRLVTSTALRAATLAASGVEVGGRPGRTADGIASRSGRSFRLDGSDQPSESDRSWRWSAG
ncbi:hypothetical protein GA0074694_1529 [Micromonospora inyonensis]|uniref:Uncharacterized protein n=1 Tax=Micromonospora inyonensis TaxID=47866 RepID=A0A1C6RGF1_9ACTN|nr:hypothetical protein GA0074694_1529 [Micromonospora inyonensis]